MKIGDKVVILNTQDRYFTQGLIVTILRMDEGNILVRHPSLSRETWIGAHNVRKAVWDIDSLKEEFFLINIVKGNIGPLMKVLDKQGEYDENQLEMSLSIAEKDINYCRKKLI